ncbi:MAG: 16S rRNA (cytidine(1402)-2'-O)-methyltransferase [Firmicutes bacterium]|nr:16S rRNA (cytidine(1402)-2'-O)-methyltransferase [Bacillota bacterium]
MTSFGTLYVCGTPIGNLSDITLRALDVFRNVNIIAAEDTRRTRKLLSHYEISTKTISYHEHNEFSRTPQLIEMLKEGKDIALVTDAGMPGISDPGSYLVNAALSNNVKVTSVPGPSAVASALSVSGFSADKFVFFGFLPRKGKRRNKILGALASETKVSVIYESPYRLLTTLSDLISTLGSDRKSVVTRELTKLHEEVIKGTLGEILEVFSQRTVKGEITIVIEGGRKEKGYQ